MSNPVSSPAIKAPHAGMSAWLTSRGRAEARRRAQEARELRAMIAELQTGR